ncbi:MAG: PIN domain-containing protein [Acidimicrobiales bacterium]
MPLPVVVDVNVLVSAVTGGHDSFLSWPSPPPLRGNLAANVVGIFNDAREFSLYMSEHILANTARVLGGATPDGYAWLPERCADYVSTLIDAAEASGGVVIEPVVVLTDCPDFEDNRILECALASNAVLIVSDDTDLLHMSPWRGTAIVSSKDFVARTDASRRARRVERD